MHGFLSDDTSEADLLFPAASTSGGDASTRRVLAVARYQTKHFASARYDTGALTNATAVSYKSTALFSSSDGGKTFGRPGLLTGQGQQSGCLVELPDKSILMVHGHKDAGEGQKFMISYDQGRTFSNTVYDLHRGGLYASSVAIGGKEIITAFSCTADSQSLCPQRANKLSTLRWQPPAEDEVARGGFFVPVEPSGAREHSSSHWAAGQ